MYDEIHNFQLRLYDKYKFIDFSFFRCYLDIFKAKILNENKKGKKIT